MVIQPLQLQACQARADVLVALCPSGCLWADIQDRWPAADNASRLTDENPLTGAGGGSEGNLLQAEMYFVNCIEYCGISSRHWKCSFSGSYLIWQQVFLFPHL